jgi:hypothetical protein
VKTRVAYSDDASQQPRRESCVRGGGYAITYPCLVDVSFSSSGRAAPPPDESLQLSKACSAPPDGRDPARVLASQLWR